MLDFASIRPDRDQLVLVAERQDLGPAIATAIPNPVLEIQNLSLFYSGELALDNVSMKIPLR
jgi:hypothetical protein